MFGFIVTPKKLSILQHYQQLLSLEFFVPKSLDTKGLGDSIFSSNLKASGVLCYHRTQSGRDRLLQAISEPIFACWGGPQSPDRKTKNACHM